MHIMNPVKSCLTIYLVLFFFTFHLHSQNPTALVPLDMVIVGFDRSINNFDDDLIVTVNFSNINPSTEWLITNAYYKGDGHIDEWDISNSEFIQYKIKYIGDVRIPKNSYISYRTNSENSSSPLIITINGLKETDLFSIERTSSSSKSSNGIIARNAFYLKQGRYYENQGQTKFLGTIVDGLFFNPVSKMPSDIGLYKTFSGIDPDAGSGNYNGQLCQCEDIEEVQNLGKWIINPGPDGNGGVDIDDTGNDVGENNCPCENGILNIQESNCVIKVDIGATYLRCESFVTYEWTIEYLNGAVEVIIGHAFSDLNEIYLPFFATAQIQLVIYCEDCNIESNVLFVDCGGKYCPPNATAEIGTCDMEVTVLDCPFNYSVEWYMQGNPDIHLTDFDNTDLLTVDINGCYYYKVHCGDCPPVVSQPYCFTNCEVDCSLLFPGVSSQVNSITVNDYCYSIPDALCTIELTNLLINNQWMLNEPPFSFPYCFQENPSCNDGLPSECKASSTHWSSLIDHINTWLSNNVFAGTASWSSDPSHPCFAESDFPVYLLIEGTDANFSSAKFVLNGNNVTCIHPDSYNYQIINLSVTYSISNLCEGGTIEWSNGDTNTLSSTYPYGTSFSVTITCPNGCVYVLDDVNCSYIGCQYAYQVGVTSNDSNWEIIDKDGNVHSFINTSSMFPCTNEDVFVDEIYNIISNLTDCDLTDLEVCLASQPHCSVIINNSPIEFTSINSSSGEYEFSTFSDNCSCEDQAASQADNTLELVLESGENAEEDNKEKSPELTKALEWNIRIFPNPSSDKFNIAFDNTLGEEVYISLYDASGKLIKHRVEDLEKRNGFLILDCNPYEAGMYMLQVSTLTRNFPIQKLLLIK